MSPLAAGVAHVPRVASPTRRLRASSRSPKSQLRASPRRFQHVPHMPLASCPNAQVYRVKSPARALVLPLPRCFYPLGISRLIADVRSCFADVCSIAPRQPTACGALDRSRRSPPRSRSVSAMAQLITQYDFSPTHPHLYVVVVYVPSSTWLGGCSLASRFAWPIHGVEGAE